MSAAGGERAPAGRARLGSLAIGASLVVVGALAWWLSLRPALAVAPESLAQIPPALGGWRGQDVALEEAVESMLRADLNVQRIYRHPLGDVVWMYVGYYGTRRGGHPEHTPRTCYEAQGWEIEAQRRVALDADLRANEMLVGREGQRRLVYFWYRSHRSTGMTSRLGLALDHLLARLSGERADGALVRVSTPLLPGEDAVAARARLRGFASGFEEQLARHWPSEVPHPGA